MESKLARNLLAAVALALGSVCAWPQVVTNPSATGISTASVTTVACTPSQGVTCTVANPTTAPALSVGLGAITPTSVNKVTVTAPATGSTLTIADGKTLTAAGTVGFVGSNTYANTLSSFPCNGTWSGYRAFISDWGANGTEARCNGTRWLPVNGQTILKRMGTPLSGIANSETIATQVQLPIGLLQTGDTIQLWSSLSKSGVTDTLNISFRVGTGCTTSDTAITGLSNASQMIAASQSGGIIQAVRVLSATSMQRLGSGSGNASGYAGTVSTAISAATTVSDVSTNSVCLTFTVKSSSTNDTVGVQEVTLVHVAG